MIRFSVCIATYNGQNYISEQIDSILQELGDNDEVIIVDDCSTDFTIRVVESYCDSRIKLFENSMNLGVNKTFERALNLARGELIFLSDQDDLWLPGRVKRMSDVLYQKKFALVSTNYIKFGDDDDLTHVIPLRESESQSNVANIWRIFTGSANYYGCAMVINRDFLKLLLPFPPFLESHDLWIAIVANIIRKNFHQEEPSLARRIHQNNFSVRRRSLFSKLRSRFIFMHHLFVAIFRSTIGR